MALQQIPLYQGRDWLTYRWTVADVFDALDRMHDLCVGHDWTAEETTAGKESSLLPALLDFACDLACSVATACADTIPANAFWGNLKHRWLCFEIRLWTRILADQIASLIAQEQPNFEETTLIIAEIKGKLSAIDT